MGTDLWHGTLNGYDAHKCRCTPCGDAKSAVNKRRYEEFKTWLATVKNRPCTDCNNTYPAACMEFDHRDPAGKRFEVSSGAMRSRLSVLAEIAKCDIVCANCHRLRTEHHRGEGSVVTGRPRKTAV